MNDKTKKYLESWHKEAFEDEEDPKQAVKNLFTEDGPWHYIDNVIIVISEDGDKFYLEKQEDGTAKEIEL